MWMYFILTIGIISYLLDVFRNKKLDSCKDRLDVNLLLLFHHILFSFVVFGLFSNNLKVIKVYACVVGVIFISWFLFNLDCLLTYLTNLSGELPLDTPFVPFYNHLLEITCKKEIQMKKDNQRAITDYLFMFTVICLALLKIGYLSKQKTKI